MRIISETASEDLSGGTLFPNLYPQYGDFDTIRSSGEYLVSSLTLGTMTEAFLQVSEEESQDVDSFVMELDAGDTYQVVFSSAETEQFLSNRGMTVFGTDGRFVDLILNDYGNTFSPSGTLTWSCRECGGNCRAAGSGHVTMAPVRPRGQGTSARAAEKEFPSRQPSASGSALTPRAPRAASARSRRRAARSGS